MRNIQVINHQYYSTKPSLLKLKTEFIVVIFLLLAFNSAWAIDSVLEKAILQEDWLFVSKSLESKDDLSVPERFIKAHAHLAVNKNNESFCVFQSVENVRNIEIWNKWSKSFLDLYPNKTIPMFFRGDALARLEKWEEALNVFNKALNIKLKNPVILNARGGVYAAMGNWDYAINDFEDAIQANSEFADAYANRGAINIFKSKGAKGAEKWFNLALQHSSGFGLALNGRGAAFYGQGPENWEKSALDFQTAAESSGCVYLAQSNWSKLEQARLELVVKNSELMLANATPGTPFTTKIKSVHQSARKALATRISQNKADFKMAKQNISKRFWSDAAAGTGNSLRKITDGVKWVASGVAAFSSTPLGKIANAHPTAKVVVNSAKPVAFISAASSELLKSGSNRLNAHSNTLTKKLNSYAYGNQGGVTADMSMSHIDEGNWPVSMVIGLVYFIVPIDNK